MRAYGARPRNPRGAVLALALVVVTAGCSNVIVGTAGRPQTVPVRLQGSPPDATVTIDDQRVGPLALIAARGIRIAPGRHWLTVEAAGYLPFDTAIDAKDEVVAVDVKLVPVPD
jgi:hypothetical protein